MRPFPAACDRLPRRDWLCMQWPRTMMVPGECPIERTTKVATGYSRAASRPADQVRAGVERPRPTLSGDVLAVARGWPAGRPRSSRPTVRSSPRPRTPARRMDQDPIKPGISRPIGTVAHPAMVSCAAAMADALHQAVDHGLDRMEMRIASGPGQGCHARPFEVNRHLLAIPYRLRPP